jgi:hypothetical protein
MKLCDVWQQGSRHLKSVGVSFEGRKGQQPVEAFKFWAEKRGFCPKTGLKRQNRRGTLDKLAPFFSALFSWRPPR